MFVPKVPRRRDFCGCPPCPICYDYVEPAPPIVVTKNDPIDVTMPAGYLIDGMRKMTEDILGKDVTPTPEQKQQLSEGAILIHERNLVNSTKTPLESHQETIDEGFTRRGVDAFLKQKATEAAVVRKPVNTITCDSIADEKAKSGKKAVPVEVEERIKNNVPVPSLDAPVDKALLKRESKNSRGYGGTDWQREEMMRRYRDNLEREKARWNDMLMGRR